ncbi:MAG: 2-oxoacid:acceptor oxidoreductase family protein [Candidatus Bipolaricaulis sp.]|nr:2-oxoacid:acceptor oxidoreductase family protein [Candidatus Bipolaricaulis sp.]MDD5219622.1 2-oxoacid:acceptor oxidoreductase family protein [Candidatus Bipolaricaulis sp.]MDD5646748.1 2-oxoacid:acceptor oxidoreductase family protein [Candidatus Bipolaricaulis sp.]
MREVRIHGRGGQGGLTAARIVANAMLKDGKNAQAFPEFGPERRGAPVRSYLRIDDQPILLRTPVTAPDTVVVMDATLLERRDTVLGIKPGGLLLVNAPERPPVVVSVPVRMAWVDAMRISASLFGKQIPNTAMLGAWCRVDGIVGQAAIEAAIREWFPAKHAEKNIEAARRAWDAVEVAELEASSASDTAKGSSAFAFLDDYPIIATAFPGEGGAGRTGSWRISDPVVDAQRCVRCGRCVTACPEGVVAMTEDGVTIDLTYCKGCGICAVECPVQAIRSGEVGA